MFIENSISSVIDYNLSIRNQILEICKPLFNNFNITYFEYDQIFNDGKVFYICTNTEWLKFSLEKKMFSDEDHVHLCSIAKSRRYRYGLWNTLKLENSHFLSNYFHHNIWNGLTINEIEDDSFNTYSFATTKDNVGLNEFILNNLPLFDHFLIYFKQKLNQILNKNMNNLTFYGSPLREISDQSLYIEGSNKINEFLEQTALDHIQLKINNKLIYFTKREFQCLNLISKGKTLKEIGAELEISHRTVETFINSIKEKTGFLFKNELISFFEKSPLRLYNIHSMKGNAKMSV